MTSDKKHSRRANPLTPRAIAKSRKSYWPTHHQAKLAGYLADGHHLVYDADRARRGLHPYRAKTLTQVAAETGMSVAAVTHWLKQEHDDLWLRWWFGRGWVSRNMAEAQPGGADRERHE
jgi:hypothetical protein